MIDTLQIKNFKGLEDIELSNIAPFTLFGGMNNIGKSTLLESIFLLYSGYSPNAFRKQFAIRNIGQLSRNRINDWQTIFYNGDIKKSIQIRGIRKGNISQLTYSIDDKAQVPTLNEAMASINTVGDNPSSIYNEGKLQMQFQQNNKLVLDASLYTNGVLQQVPIDKKIVDQLQLPVVTILLASGRPFLDIDTLKELDVNNKLDILLDALALIEPAIKGISLVPVEHMINPVVINGVQLPPTSTMTPEIYVDIGLARKLPLKLVGDGMIHLLSFLLAIIKSKNGIVLIDELENGFYYAYRVGILEKILKIADAYHCQIIATTHSYECLQDCLEASQNTNTDFTYTRIERNDKKIVPITYDRSEIALAFQENMEVR